MKRGAPATIDIDDETRMQLRSELLASSRGSKASVARILQTLNRKGMLRDEELGGRDELRQVRIAAEMHGRARTPYGPVVQTLDVPGIGPWEYVHPFAFLHYMSTISEKFANMLSDALGKAPLFTCSLVFYGGEMTPGNPLRSDVGRQLWNFYYTFLELPGWLLHRTGGWFCLGGVRTRLVERIPGGVSALLKQILVAMFVDGPHNFTRGFVVPHGSAVRVFRARLVGFLADEKGHKEFLAIKGAAGLKPCISCMNVVNFIHKTGYADGQYTVGLDCVDKSKFKQLDDDTFWRMHEILVSQVGQISTSKVEALETKLGISYNEHGMLCDPRLRSVLRPVSNYIRDWQHTLVSHGVAGLQIAALTSCLKRSNIGMYEIAAYARLYIHPKLTASPPKPEWFTENFIASDHVKLFASDVLGLCPLLLAFLRDRCSGRAPADRVRCFELLTFMLGLLSGEDDMTGALHATLAGAIAEHAVLFRRLYHAFIKVKFHHLVHVPDDLLRLGKVISCFAPERKHKDVKTSVVHVYNQVEHTTTFGYLNSYVQDVVEGRFQFDEQYISTSKRRKLDIAGIQMDTSAEAALKCGGVKRDDYVLIRTGGALRLGRVVLFYAMGDFITVHVREATAVDPGTWTIWDESATPDVFLDPTSIVKPVVYMRIPPSTVKIIVPYYHGRGA